MAFDLRPVSFDPYFNFNNDGIWLRDAYESFTVQLQNTGDESVDPAQEIELTLYLSTDTVIDASSVALYTFSTFGAESGPFGYQNFNQGLEVTTALPEGDYYLSVMADSADAVAESDESNNISDFISVTLLNPKPDLTGYSYSNTYTELYGSAVEAGAVLSFDVSLSNNTEIAAPIGATAGIYLSDDETITTDDRLIGTIDMPGLGSYGSEFGGFDFAMPDDLAEGTYYTGLVVDIDDVVEELNEENNGADYGDQITVAGPGRVEITDYSGTDFDGVVLEGVGISAELAGRYKQTYTYDQMYQWYRDGEAVGEALDQYDYYYTSQADVGAALTVGVTYTDVNGDMASYTSAAVTVENVDDMPQGDVFIVSDAESGDFEEDATLTVNVDDLTDQDGLGELSYQWVTEVYDEDFGEYGGYVRTAIEGATGASFTPTQAEAGKNISVDITYVDGFGNENTVENVRAENYNTYVHNVDDPLTGEVVIIGTAAEDQILTADVSGVMDEDGLTGDAGYGQIYYNWFIGDNATTYSTDNTYQLTQNDVGYEVRVQIDVNDDFGGYASLLSAPTAVVENVNDAPEGEVLIIGDAEQGAYLYLDNLGYDEDGIDYDTVSYQWTRDGEAIEGATSFDYTLTQSDVGAVIGATVSYTDNHGTPEMVTATDTGPVSNINDAPAGGVSLGGVAAEDGVLTADTSALSDLDGLGELSYQWLRDGEAIEGATDASLALTQEDVGDRFEAVVSYTDGFGASEAVTSGSSDTVLNVNDVPTGAVTLSGEATQGSTLSVDFSTVADADGYDADTATITWQRDGVTVAGQNSSIYMLGQADVGAAITAQIQYTDGFGTVETLTSDATDEVENVNDAPTGALALDGSVIEGGVISAVSTALADADGLGDLSYQWLRDGDAVEGATAADYTLTQADVGAVMSVTASYTDGFGMVETLTSPASEAIENVNDAPTGDLALFGTVTEGEVISVSAGSLADEDGLGTLSYQWLRNGEVIAGATSEDYRLTQADVGAGMSATISYTDGFGAEETMTSVRTTPIRNVNDAPVGTVLVTGDAITGSTLTAAADLSDEDGMGALSYQWLRGNDAIEGATDETYVLGDDDLGGLISVRVSYTDGQDMTEAVNSAQTEAVVSLSTETNGTPADERLVGGAGDDVINGMGGQDTLRGEGGDDLITGGNGPDRIDGGDGQDTLIGGTGDTDKRDVIFGGAGDDLIDGGYGNDELNGGAGNDTIMGGFGGDTVIGNGGDDHLSGGALGDILYGNDGDDFINGGFGYDRMNGGEGADTFYHLGVYDHGSDWIQDYNAAEGDVLQIGRNTATRDQFQLNRANTADAGADDVDEMFVIYRPTGQVLWALVDGDAQSEINLQIGTDVFDLMS